jgi:hypothetical protein
VIECIGGIPKSNVILFYGAGTRLAPVRRGRLCASAPYHREPMKVFDSMGMVQYSIPVSLQMVGAARFYQFWGRDTNHPDARVRCSATRSRCTSRTDPLGSVAHAPAALLPGAGGRALE